MSLFGPPPGHQPSAVEKDLIERWKPSEEQVAAAVSALKEAEAAHPEADLLAAVPLAMPGKSYGFWEVGQAVCPVEGVWVGENSFEPAEGLESYAVARNETSEAAEEFLKSAGLKGTTAWATVYSDGSWSVFEGSEVK